MIAAKLRWLPLLALCLVALTTPRVSSQSCASPVSPGKWSGEIHEIWHMNSPASGVHSIDAVLNLDISCSAQVTGSITGHTAMKGAFDEPWGRFALSGDVERNEKGQPVIRVKGLIGANGGSKHTISLHVETSGATTISGTRQWLDGDLTGGNGIAVWSWSLTSSGVAVPPKDQPPPKDQTPKPPVIASFGGQFEKNFLAGIQSVADKFTVVVDWQGEGPGTIQFSLDGAALAKQSTSTGAVATVQVDALAPGTHTVAVTASSKGGQISASKQFSVVTVPAWAAALNMAPQAAAPRIVYRGTKTLMLTPAITQVAGTVPIFSGAMGTLQASFVVPASAASLDPQQDTRPVTGKIDVMVSGNQGMSFAALGTSFTRANLTSAALDFQNGEIDLVSQAVSSQSMSILKVAPQTLDVVPTAQVKVSYLANVSGTIQLGIQNDALSITGGTLTIQIGATLTPTVLLTSENGQLQILGSGQTTLQVALTPTPHLVSCVGSATVTLVNLTPETSTTSPALQNGNFATCN